MVSVSSRARRQTSEVVSDLWLAVREVRYEQIAFWKNRIGALFTVGFSILYLVMLGIFVGGERVTVLGSSVRMVQYYVPTFVAYAVMATCFTTLAIQLVVRRETGLLKRLRLSPIPTWVLITSIFASELIVVFVQVVLLLVIGRIAFNVQLPISVGDFVLAVVVRSVCFTALGVAMSTAIPRMEAAGPVTSTLFFVLLFLSGLYFPFPDSWLLSKILSWVPIRALIESVFASYTSQVSWDSAAWHDLLVFALWGVGGCALALWRFRWAPSRSR